MKKFVSILLLGTCLNISWAEESVKEDIITDETSIKHTVEPIDGHPSKFAELAKTTIDLMSPEIEASQNKEQKNKRLQN